MRRDPKKVRAPSATGDERFRWPELLPLVADSSFSRLDLGDELLERRKLYDVLYPVGTEADTFEQAAAKILGLTRPVIRKAVDLADALGPEDKARIRSIRGARERARAEVKAATEVARRRKAADLARRAEARAQRLGPDLVSRSRVDLGDNADVLKAYHERGLTFDLVLTDPPYSLRWNKINHTERTDLNEEPTWDDLDVGWVFRVAPVLAKVSTVIAFCPAEAIGVYREVFEAVDLNYRGALVWHKSNPAPQHRPGYMQATEYIVWATRGSAYFAPWENAGAREAHNVIENSVCNSVERLNHPTQKPLAVLDRLICRHAADGALVLDPFCGVGSTIVAAIQRGLVGYGIELDPEYHKIAADRVAVTTWEEKVCERESQKS